MTLDQARDLVARHRRTLVAAGDVDAPLLKALHTLDSCAVAVLAVKSLLDLDADE